MYIRIKAQGFSVFCPLNIYSSRTKDSILIEDHLTICTSLLHFSIYEKRVHQLKCEFEYVVIDFPEIISINIPYPIKKAHFELQSH